MTIMKWDELSRNYWRLDVEDLNIIVDVEQVCNSLPWIWKILDKNSIDVIDYKWLCGYKETEEEAKREAEKKLIELIKARRDFWSDKLKRIESAL